MLKAQIDGEWKPILMAPFVKTPNYVICSAN